MSKETIRFGYGDVHEYDPTHNDIDWRARFIGECAAYGFELPKPVWVENDDGLQQELHQENFYIWLNETSDPLDCIQVMDNRDKYAWTFFRDDFPPEEFERIVQSIGYAATLIHTMFPAKMVQDLYERMQWHDVETIDTVPEDWT